LRTLPEIWTRRLRKLFGLALGWSLLIAGALIMPLPVPIPFIGAVPLLLGCAILTSHSRYFRRSLQGLRHRWAFLSRSLEHLATRGPHSVKAMIKRTNPHALARYLRMQIRGER
jgi:hypothetical protein